MAKKPFEPFNKAKKPRPSLYKFYSGVVWAWLRSKARLRVTFDCELPEQFVLVCNHPSGMDNFYAMRALRPHTVCFVANRYYTYHKIIGKFFEAMGSIPKSLFTTDMASVKNTLAMKEAGVPLGFMPEVRLSMSGEMQKLPESTGKFFKMLKLPVFLCHFDGSYLVKPKWSKHRRRGEVEVKVRQLYDAQTLAQTSDEELQATLEKNLYYNDFEWLKNHPKAKYRCKKQAEGLEKILTLCPHCKKHYTIRTKGKKVYCDSCGYTVEVDDRYAFVDKGFEHYYDNFQQWYDDIRRDCWQRVDENPDYTLTEKVKIKVPSSDGKTFLRDAGEGVVILNADGLTFDGVKDGEAFAFKIPMHDGFYLSYGMNVGFQTFRGAKEYYAFCPDDVSKSLEWYLASERLSHNFIKKLRADQ